MAAARRAPLNDVAAESGVCRATVSFVLDDGPRQTISETTRDRAPALPDHDLPSTGVRSTGVRSAGGRPRSARETAHRPGLASSASFEASRPREAGMDAVRALHAEHPEATAVAAYDDTGYGALVTPTLTTVRIDAEPCVPRAAVVRGSA
ncbi:hypothetical protein [Streptomyces sp. NPDC051677]|uniref:hypothetical protein n=1 Tax=Streptomyces sp. NPDC051677 TaxID=3365669 RepID=UPI0037D961F2